MKWLRFLPILLVLGLGGCETLDTGDRSILRQHQVSDAVYDKMLHNERLELPDITELSRKGLPDPFILRYLRSTYATYQLTTADVSRLTRAGVSRGVIDYLLATPSMYGPQPYPYGPAAYAYGPYPYYDYPPVILVNPRPYHRW